MSKLQQFWESLWKDKMDPFSEVSVHRDSNPVEGVDVPATMKVLRLPMIFSSISDVMIRDDYGEAMRDIESYDTRGKKKKKSVIILGNPGIGRITGSVGQAWVLTSPPYLGKTILLYYILVKRLFEEKRTILQISPQYFLFFNADGVEVLFTSSLEGLFLDPQFEKYRNTWALIDISVHLESPAEVLSKDNSPFFLVVASSPRPSRLRELNKYARPSTYWFMKPFTLAELIQASVFLSSISSFVTYVMAQSSTSRGYSRGVRYCELL